MKKNASFFPGFSRGRNKSESFQAVHGEKDLPFVILNPDFHNDRLISESLDFKGIKGCEIQKQIRIDHSRAICFVMTLRISLSCIPYQPLRYSTCLIMTIATRDYFSARPSPPQRRHFSPGFSYRFLAYAGVPFFIRRQIFQQRRFI